MHACMPMGPMHARKVDCSVRCTLAHIWMSIGCASISGASSDLWFVVTRWYTHAVSA